MRSGVSGRLAIEQAAQPLLDKAGVVPDEGVTDLRGSFVEQPPALFAREPSVRTLARSGIPTFGAEPRTGMGNEIGWCAMPHRQTSHTSGRFLLY